MTLRTKNGLTRDELTHFFFDKYGLMQNQKTPANNAINADSEKRRSFVAPLFTAGYGER